MLDIKLIRENPDKVKDAIASKGADPKLVDQFLKADSAWRELTQEIEALRSEQKKATRSTGSGQVEARDIEKGKKLKIEIQDREAAQRILAEKRDGILDGLPNIPFPDAPVGRDERENKVLREIGEKPEFPFEAKDYMALAEAHDLVDTKKAAEVSGSRFGYLKTEAVLMEFGLVELGMKFLVGKGFSPVVPPVMIRPEVYRGMGRLAGDQKEERYYFEKDDLYLVGSSEHTVGPLHLNDVIEEGKLPRHYVAFSTCFRREAGSYGKDTKGILRVHQFDKLEMFSFAKPAESEKEHQFLLSLQEELMQKLELPYRVVEICTGDMGWTDARQYDIETWMPGENKYRETHSCSNTTDFQARGINAKFRAGGKTEFLHMLNATVFAVGRTLIAIFENCQTKDGKIKIPKVLQPYVGKEIIG